MNALPGNSIASKTAILSAGAGASVAAISNEIYVVNEESIIAFSLITVYWAIYTYGGPAYKEWAEGQRDKIKGVLKCDSRTFLPCICNVICSVPAVLLAACKLESCLSRFDVHAELLIPLHLTFWCCIRWL